MARHEFMKGLPVITMAEGKQVGNEDMIVVSSLAVAGPEGQAGAEKVLTAPRATQGEDQ